MYWSCPVTLLGVTPYIVSSLPLIWGQCGYIVPALPLIWGAVQTLYPNCPGQYGDNVSAVLLAVQRHCMVYPLAMYRGSPETLLGITWDNAGVACFVFPDWIGNHTFRSHSNAFLFPTEWRKEWESFKLERINTTRSARLPTSTPLGLLRHFPVLGSVTLT